MTLFFSWLWWILCHGIICWIWERYGRDYFDHCEKLFNILIPKQTRKCVWNSTVQLYNSDNKRLTYYIPCHLHALRAPQCRVHALQSLVKTYLNVCRGNRLPMCSCLLVTSLFPKFLPSWWVCWNLYHLLVYCPLWTQFYQPIWYWILNPPQRDQMNRWHCMKKKKKHEMLQCFMNAFR